MKTVSTETELAWRIPIFRLGDMEHLGSIRQHRVWLTVSGIDPTTRALSYTKAGYSAASKPNVLRRGSKVTWKARRVAGEPRRAERPALSARGSPIHLG